jgi:hypothetical protein
MGRIKKEKKTVSLTSVSGSHLYGRPDYGSYPGAPPGMGKYYILCSIDVKG